MMFVSTEHHRGVIVKDSVFISVPNLYDLCVEIYHSHFFVEPRETFVNFCQLPFFMKLVELISTTSVFKFTKEVFWSIFHKAYKVDTKGNTKNSKEYLDCRSIISLHQVGEKTL